MANLYSTRNIIKIPSTVLSDSQPKWKLNVSLQELQSANQIIQLASSYITRMMDVVVEDGLHLENIEDGEKRLKTILGVIEKKEEKRKSIKEKIIKTVKKDSSSNTKKSVEKWSRDLFKETYIPHLCCIHIDKTSHYDRLNKGFTITLFDEESGEVISEVNFKRFLSTSASIKESEVFYVNEIYKEILEEYINCGRDMSVGFVPAKLSAYQALTMSSSNLVTNTYNVCVVDDIEHEITTSVMELDDSKQEEPIITRIDDYKMNLNCSDGFGFIDPTFAETWANDLQLYHTPSAFIVRNAFCKGVLARFPYKEFAKENNIDAIKDVWGKEWNIDEVDIVLTTSMLKLANSYPSWDDYFQKTQKYGYTFSVTKQTPKTLDMERTTNYQFIQSMDWDDEDIKGFLKPSIDEIKAIKGEDWRQSLVYLRGMNLTEDSNVVRNEFTTGMMIEPNLIKDPYVRSSINQMIKKRINDCKKGTIKVRGNYQTVICDPILLAQSMLGLEVKGILKEGEFHSEFWNRLGIDYVIQFRAPMVSANNIGCANLVTNEETKRWYRYLDTLFIFNGYDATCARLSGCDFDGDTVFSTDNEYIIKGTNKNLLPVVCLQKSSSKQICDENSFIEADKILIKGTVENVGTVTNRATAIESFKARFPKDSKEWKELDYRVQACIAISQNSIDCAKGIKIEYGFPKSWIRNKPNMIHESDDEKERERKEFYQTLVCDKKPYFFIYIYDTLKKEYNKVYKNENRRCLKMFGRSLDEILANPCSEEESKAKFYYEMVRNVDMSPSVMNKIAWYVEQEFKNFKLSNMGVEDCVTSLKTDKPYKKSTYKKIANLYDEYLSIMRKTSSSFKMRKSVGSEKVSERDLQFRLFKNKLYLICPNEEDLCNILLDICYENSQRSKYLAWQICGEQIINNLLEKNNRIVSYPVMVEEDGDFIYKGYSFKIFTKEVE